VGTPRGGRPYGADRSKGQKLERFGHVTPPGSGAKGLYAAGVSPSASRTDVRRAELLDHGVVQVG
jgi:hypothetical protein